MQKLNFFFFLYASSFIFILNLIEELNRISINIILDNFTKIIIIILLIFSYIIYNVNYKNTNNYLLVLLISLLTIILILFFINENILFFYFFFEFSIIPIIFLVTTWGYSIERIKAMIYIYIYTIIFSLPFFIVIIFYSLNVKSFSLILNEYFIWFSQENLFFLFPLIFLVKIPVWGFHFWLPKAHVEASTEGSMILAGVILKLRGVGLVKFSYFMGFSRINNFFIFSFCCIRIIGAIIISLIRLRQSDSKSVVALSSVVHMRIIFLVYVYSSRLSLEAIYLIIISHGFVRPLIFYFLGLIYDKTLTRSLRIRRGVLKNFNYIIIIWFILCVLNIGIPLSINFLRELEFFFSSRNFCFIVVACIVVVTLFRGVFNIYLFNFFSSGKIKIFFYLKESNLNTILLYSSLLYVFIFFLIIEEI